MTDLYPDLDFQNPEEDLLQSARNGDTSRVSDLLLKASAGDILLDINCKGNQKSNRGWTPLHLASYFGHDGVVRMLLEHKVDVNAVNNVGDTALHRAAYTGRMEVVTILIQREADVSVINSEGRTARMTAKSQGIAALIEAAEKHDMKTTEQELITAARDGDIDKISCLLKRCNPPSINCVDTFWNTALHIAAIQDQRQTAVFLMQNGIDSTIKNNKGMRAVELARTPQMKQLLDVVPVKDLQKQPQRVEGELLKVVGDASTGSKRKGMKYLDEAKIFLPDGNRGKDRAMMFVIHFSDGTIHTLSIGPDDASPVSLQKWLNAFQEHIAYSTHYIHSGEALDEDDDAIQPLGSMQEALQTAQAQHQILEKSLSQLSQDDPGNTSFELRVQSILATSNDMVSSLSYCMALFNQQEELRKLQLKEEMEKSRVLQEALHALATEHHALETSVSRHSARFYDTDDDEYYDCSDDGSGSHEFGSFPEITSQYDAMSFTSTHEYTEEDESNKRSESEALANDDANHEKKINDFLSPLVFHTK